MKNSKKQAEANIVKYKQCFSETNSENKEKIVALCGFQNIKFFLKRNHDKWR